MTARRPAFVALAVSFMAAASPAAESTWPTSSASDFSIFVTLQRFRIQADQCSDKVPGLKPRFDGLMERMSRHIHGISQALIASDVFKDMKTQSVPVAISFAFKDSLEDARHNFERQDADSVCPKKLQDLDEIDDESLRSDLTQTLLAVQSMIRNLEKESARKVSPDDRGQRSGLP